MLVIRNNLSNTVSFNGFYIRKDPKDYTFDNQSTFTLGTRIYRDPTFWKGLPIYLEKRFASQKDIDVIQGACSVGLETWTLKSCLKEQLNLKNYRKYHVIACDPDQTSINLAKTHNIFFSDKDRDINWSTEAGISDISKYYISLQGNERLNALKSAFEMLQEGNARNVSLDNDFCIVQEELRSDGKISKRTVNSVYKVADCLTQDTKFQAAYMQDILRTRRNKNEPCIVILRNAACGMRKDVREQLASDIYKSIPKGSIFIIGLSDENVRKTSPFSDQLKRAGFIRVSENQNDTGFFIFEKN